MPARRRGTAPLEFILVLPIIALLAALTLWLGRAGSAKLAAQAEARAQAFAQRAHAEHHVALAVEQLPRAGWVHGASQVQIPGSGPFASFPAEAAAALTTLGGTGRQGTPPAAIGPHAELLRELIHANPASLGSLLRALATLTAAASATF